jgi:hypothetical protein
MGIFIDSFDDFWKAVDTGKNVKLVTDGTGKTSVDTPLIGVGNIPYEEAKTGPNKYLNGEFRQLMIKTTKGYAPYKHGGEYDLPDDGTLTIKTKVCNTQVSEWIAPINTGDGTGGVYISATGADKTSYDVAIKKDVVHLDILDMGEITFDLKNIKKTDGMVTLTFYAKNRLYFGEKAVIKVK